MFVAFHDSLDHRFEKALCSVLFSCIIIKNKKVNNSVIKKINYKNKRTYFNKTFVPMVTR